MYQFFGKRLFDVVLSLLAIVFLFPVILALIFLIRAKLGAPIFFRQRRPGLNERPFTLIKFRTMTSERDEAGRLLSDEVRLTTFGRWLRRTSLDELPELFNILKGDMSFVGPRPLLMEYLSEYTGEQRRRHSVRPGLTGLAQVRGRNKIGWNEKFLHDLEYIDNIRFSGDVSIIAQTAFKVLRRDGITTHEGNSPMPYRRAAAHAEGIIASHSTGQQHSEPQCVESVGRWPYFGPEEIAAATRCLETGRVNYWTGNEIPAFEQEFAEYIGVDYAVAVANGTVAIELALKALGVGRGDEVIVPSRTFAATASAVAVCGATPVFADSCWETGGLSRRTVEAVLSPKTKAVIVVHVGGYPVAIKPLQQLTTEKGLFLIEDCSQAHGAMVADKKVGSFGDVAAFSFCQDKLMTTAGEGGILVTNQRSLFEAAWSYKDHGKTIKARARTPGDGTFRFVHESIGTNWRMSELHAAVGRIQLRKLPEWLKKRRSNAMRIQSALGGLGVIRWQKVMEYSTPAYYRLYGFVDSARLRTGWDRDRIIRELVAMDVGIGIGSCGVVHRENAFAKADKRPACPCAEKIHECGIAFLVHPTLSNDMVTDVINRSVDILSRASVTKAVA